MVHASAMAIAVILPLNSHRHAYVGRTRTDDSPVGFSATQRASTNVARASPIPATR